MSARPKAAPGSSSGPSRINTASRDEDDSDNEDDVLASDPLNTNHTSGKGRQSRNSIASDLLSPRSASEGRAQAASSTPRRRRTPIFDGADDRNDATQPNTNSMNGSTFWQENKPPGTIDWYSEGPGRRVGYDDLTAIDWIFEYAKERQRLRVLYSSATGFLGQIQRLADASQIWWILILTGISTGIVAGCIDVVSDWLGDLKQGICREGVGGGSFYLNRKFCCWGYDEYSQCNFWYSWGGHLGIENRAGGWTIEYVFFVIFSVSKSPLPAEVEILTAPRILFAVCAAVLVKNYSKYAKQSGIPEVKTVLGGFVMRQFMDSWTLVVKSLGLCLSVASGLWLGKEGPLVHVACCCANLSLKLFNSLNNNEARKREVLSAAAAAGISVAFGAPIGGVLFSLEQLSYYFPDKTMWQSFVCAMIAAVTLQLFNPFRTGNLVLYEVTYSSGWHGFELVPFALLGILGGLYGAFFIKLNMRVAEWRKNSKILKEPILEVVAIAIITALINYPNEFMRAQSSELVATLFAECSSLTDKHLGLCGNAPAAAVVASLLSASLLGFFLASITFGLQIPAGIILPSLAIGALYGRAVGLVLRTWHNEYPGAFFFANCEPDIPCVTAGTYAIIGAASALAGVTRMTVSIVVIMFELTGALTYVLPIMVSVMISKWVGDAFGQRGIYESWIHFNEYPFLDNHSDAPVADVAVSHLMTRIEDLVVITATGHTIESLERLLKTQPFRGYPVINNPRDALLLGYISRTELSFALSHARSTSRNLTGTSEAFLTHQPLADPNATLDLRPWMDQTPITLSSKSSLQMATDLFLKLGLRYVLFCERGVLKGLFTKKDVWMLLNETNGEVRTGGDGSGRLRENGVGERGGLLRDDDEQAVEDEREAIRVG